MDRKAKIVATLGPSSSDKSTIRQMMMAGMDVARINFSHGNHDLNKKLYEQLRRIAGNLNQPICILQDLQGPKIRTGELETDGVSLVAGESIILTTDDILGNQDRIPVDFPEIAMFVRKGSQILLDDGNLELVVTKVENDEVVTEVVIGGILKSHKGINLPGTKLTIPGFTAKDKVDLRFGLELGVDAIAISFVRTPEDISRVKNEIRLFNQEFPDAHIYPPVIAKLERPEALDNLDAIVDLADGVMVARGDLGVEMSPEEVPIAQKTIIDTANRFGKIVITATQMLESMILNPRPTRAEASDVANAIFDGTDAVMLSGETAVGKYPVKVIEMMNAIVCQAEGHINQFGRPRESILAKEHDNVISITAAARELAHDVHVDSIAVFTQTGHTARMMSKVTPHVPILAFTPNERTYNMMSMYWDVYPMLVPHATSLEEMLVHVNMGVLATQPYKEGQQVVVVSSIPVGEVLPPNFAMLHEIRKPG